MDAHPDWEACGMMTSSQDINIAGLVLPPNLHTLDMAGYKLYLEVRP
jgi:hypothetical protein